jgi:hypothetical protein
VLEREFFTYVFEPHADALRQAYASAAGEAWKLNAGL